MQWTEKYNVYSINVKAGWLTVAYESGPAGKRGGYRVKAFGRALKELSPDLDHGKARAVALARSILMDSLKALEE